ncbi:MAG: T9SS type A sorting domain-containing protein [Bacteroidota bacterium]
MKNLILIFLIAVSSLSNAQLNIAQPSDLSLCDADSDGFEIFDLTSTEFEILNGLDASMHSILYYETLEDAQNDLNPIGNPTNYANTTNPQTIHVRLWENADISNFELTNFNILAAGSPSIVQPPNLFVYQFPVTGIAEFDLTTNEDVMLNGMSPASVTTTYHATLADALTQTNPYPSLTNYNNTSNPETVYVNVSNNNTGCFETTSFELIVDDDVINIPDANFLSRLITNGVDTNDSGNVQSFEATAIINLNVSNSNISDLTGIEAFTAVDSLNCRNNQIADFDLSQNSNLRILVASENNLTDIDLTLNPLLEDLYCRENELTTLDLSSNPALETVRCEQNQLTSIDVASNPSLRILEAWSNPLSQLDVSNNVSLERLGFSQSNIVTLDCNNNINLTSLFIAGNNLLETVFIKNGSDESSEMGSGSWLENWLSGNNPSLSFVCADENQVLEIQSFAGTDYPVSSYCSTTPGGDFNTISGNVLFDFDGNGCDPMDMPQPYFRMDIDDGVTQGATFSNSNGAYNFYTLDGVFDISPNIEQPTWFTVAPVSATIPFVDTNNNVTTQDFCLSANGIHNDVEITIAPIMPARPGFDAVYLISYSNKGNQMVSGDIEFTYDETVLDFVSATQTPDNQDSGSLAWNYDDLMPFENRNVYVTLNVNAPTETPPVNIDDELAFQATINPISGDEFDSDNVFDYNQIVVGAFDPNDITCLQGDILPTNEIGSFLHYIIRFENIGTAAAENVVVEVDVDEAQFDINTLRVLNASHEMQTQLQNNKIRFVFDGINLNGSGGHGNILIRMKSNGDLVSGDAVAKKANIFFDFNFPIETNVATTTFESNLSDTNPQLDDSIQFYPNPVSDFVNIEAASHIKLIVIYDLQGRMLSTELPNEREVQLDMSTYSSGFYIIKVNCNEGSLTKRIVKN